MYSIHEMILTNIEGPTVDNNNKNQLFFNKPLWFMEVDSII